MDAIQADAAQTVLIVDDDEAIRGLLVELLRLAGYSTATAVDGEDALCYLRANPLPAVILLDLMMPRMDGWEFRREQRTDSRLAGIPVIVTSAVSRDEQVANSIRAVAYLDKPFNSKLLLQLVGLFCRGS